MLNYDNFAETFAKSRKNMKWQEIDYFLNNYFISSFKGGLEGDILDIWCGSWRLLEQLLTSPLAPLLKGEGKYTWIDLSSWLLKEAKKSFPDKEFLKLNMLDLDSPLLIKEGVRGWSYLFFIPSFHHLDNLEDREEVLKKAYNLLEKWWKIFMTNWALNSKLNKEKYNNSIIENSKNKFWSIDYSIKIWKDTRYYHCFDLSELEYLAKKSWFKIIENRLFDNMRNFITILEK